MAWASNTDNEVPEEQEHPQYVQIVSNNIYAKFGAAMTNIIEAISKIIISDKIGWQHW